MSDQPSIFDALEQQTRIERARREIERATGDAAWRLSHIERARINSLRAVVWEYDQERALEDEERARVVEKIREVEKRRERARRERRRAEQEAEAREKNYETAEQMWEAEAGERRKKRHLEQEEAAAIRRWEQAAGDRKLAALMELLDGPRPVTLHFEHRGERHPDISRTVSTRDILAAFQEEVSSAGTPYGGSDGYRVGYRKGGTCYGIPPEGSVGAGIRCYTWGMAHRNRPSDSKGRNQGRHKHLTP